MSKTSIYKISILLLLLVTCFNTEKDVQTNADLNSSRIKAIVSKFAHVFKYLQSVSKKTRNDKFLIQKIPTILGTKLTTSNTKMIPYVNSIIHATLTNEKFKIEDNFENPMENENLKVLCPAYFLIMCHKENFIDFEPRDKFLENLSMAKSQKLELESLGYKLEQWEEIMFEFFVALEAKNNLKINFLINFHSTYCSDDLLGFTYFKLNSLIGFGYDKVKHAKFIFDSYYKNSKEVSNKILEKESTIEMIDYYYILAYVFIAEEVREFDLCFKLCEIGLNYRLNLYLVHSAIHVLQTKDMFKKSLEYFYEKTRGIALQSIGGTFIYQHVNWHIAIALLIESVRNNDSFLFKESLNLFTSVIIKTFYIDTECFVNIFGYIMWVYSTSNGEKNLNYFLENNLITDEQLKSLNFVASNTSYLSKHSIYDYFSIWFLAQQKKTEEVDALLSKIKSNIELFNSKYSDNIPENELFFYNNIYYEFCLAFKYFGEEQKDKGRSLLLKNKNYFNYNSGSTEQILILEILAHK